MAADTRYYIIAVDGKVTNLVEAQNPAQAIKHVTRGKYTATPATTKDVATLLVDKGMKIEKAKPEQLALLE